MPEVEKKGADAPVTAADKIVTALNEQKSFIGEGFKKLDNELITVKSRLDEVESKVKPMKGISLPGVDEGKEEFSFFKAISAIKTGRWDDAGFEKSVFEETRKKAMSTGSNSAGGYIVPNQYIASLIDLLTAQSVVAKMGATMLNDLNASPIQIPRQTAGSTAYWVAENAAITESALTVDQLSLTPHAVAAMVKMSNRLLALSNPSAEAMVRNDIARSLALAIDLAALRGAGASGQPTGIANTGSILTVSAGASGGVFNFEVAEQMVSELDNVNSLQGALGFIMHPKVKSKMKRERIAEYAGQTDGEYAVLPMSDGKLAELLGWNFATTTQIPTNLSEGGVNTLSEVYFGNWQDLIIASWGGMQIMASSETSTAFETNQTWVRVIQEVDIGIRHAASFCLCSDAKTV